MLIKNKLTLLFTFLVAIILIALNFYIYFLSSSFTHNKFYKQLKDRAVISATIFLEEDEQSNSVIKAFQKKYQQELPGESIHIYNYKNEPVFIDTTQRYIPSISVLNTIREKNEFEFDEGDRQAYGTYYHDNQGDFVILVSALDETGVKHLKELEYILIAGFVCSVIVLFFAGRYFTMLMLRPISLITEQTNKISETNLHLHLDEGNKKDELAGLSITINKMLQRLENAFEEQKNFVSNASHELRTPLTAIIGNIEVTLSKARTLDEHKSVLLSIMKEAERLQRLSDGLLLIAQSNPDNIKLKNEEIRIDELLYELKNEIKTKRPSSNVEIFFTGMPENSNDLILHGNKNLLEIAILNLLDNACKFSDNKSVIVTLKIEINKIEIEIKDTGIGINEVDLPHITETFYRANNARTYEGYGIGLALSDKIIRMHKGKMSISSKLDVGTSVTITFSRGAS